MENLVKTTTLSFDSTKDGFKAHATIVKDSEGNIKTLTLNGIEQNGNTWLGDLTFNATATAQMAGISALLAQVLTEAANEGNSQEESPNEGNSEE